MFDKILVGTDGSENSERALKKADEIRIKWDSQMVVFHSTNHKMPKPTISLTTPYPTMMNYTAGILTVPNNEEHALQYEIPKEDYEKIVEGYKNQGVKIIDRAKQTLNFEEENVKYRLIVDIDPEDYIIEQAEEEGFDLVVLGCKGEHSKLERVFLGTVSTKVLNEASCDVLVIR